MTQQGIWFPDQAIGFVKTFVSQWLPPEAGAIFIDTVGFVQDASVRQLLEEHRQQLVMLPYLTAEALMQSLDSLQGSRQKGDPTDATEQ